LRLGPEGQNVTLRIGRAAKRDAVLVKVEANEEHLRLLGRNGRTGD
jgi:hypothetical protein